MLPFPPSMAPDLSKVHIRILESTQENISNLILGLEYLINISYVDDTEVFKDMACDTFLEIVQKCKRKFVITQVGENEPFVSELLSALPITISDLKTHHIHSFYESQWMEIIGQAHQNVEFLKDQYVIRTVLNIFQRNTRVASSLGTIFLPQITLIFLDMLNVYRMYNELISKSFSEWGPYVSKHYM
ncbi:protein EXPORTIN 1A [Trifolium repens]|nr:protein EXPORTIN 1A [Trifolium repens]